MANPIISVIVLFTTLLYTSSGGYLVPTQAYFDVVKLGAKPDGRTDTTQFFLDAWANACGSVKPATIYVPKGRYLVNNIVFGGPCNNIDITFRINGTLMAPFDYNALASSENWISFKRVTGVSIYGGNLDAKGAALWACKAANKDCPLGTTSLRFIRSKNIVINGLRSYNSQMFHIAINGCENVYMEGVKVTAPDNSPNNVYMEGVKVTAPDNSPNTDGIHVQLSTGVTIMRSGIKTGDDCISIGPGTENLWIERIACGPGHGISIGGLAKELDEPGVQNVTVKRAVFTGTQNGLRIKAWGRPSNGFVKGVLFQHAIMKNVQNPVVIDQNYCPHNKNCPNQVSGIKISEITYQDIQGTSATQVAVNFDCSNKNPCQGIKLVNVKLTYKDRPALSSCTNAIGLAQGFIQPDSCLL